MRVALGGAEDAGPSGVDRDRDVARLVRSTYARRDVACGSPECVAHAELNAALGVRDFLRSREQGCRAYVVPDLCAFRKYPEVFASGVVRDVIASRAHARRLGGRSGGVGLGGLPSMSRSMKGDSRAMGKNRSVFVFDDEHCVEVVRAMRSRSMSREVACAAHYAKKVRGKFPIVVVSDAQAANAANAADDVGARHALPEGVVVLSVEGFIEQFCGGSEGEAARAAYEAARDAEDEMEGDSAVASTSTGTNYEAHWNERDLELGLSEGVLVKGVLKVKALGVKCEGHVDGVFIPSKHAMNRAMHGDVVAVEVAPESEWCASRINTVLEDEGVRESDLSASVSSSPKTRTGKIVGILRREVMDVVACLDSIDEEEITRNPHAKRNGALCVPMDGKIVKIKLLTRRANELVGKRFVVRVDRWRENQRYPNGHLIRVLGDVGDVDGEMAALLARHEIPAEPFGARALAELPREGTNWVVPREELETRRDLRHHRACSIDPPGCTDVDDALSVRAVPQSERGANAGAFEIGVHIADVSYFVQPGTTLDHEAQTRGTTVYLVDRRLDMLPSLLSENLASLLEKRDRLAMSCVWTLDENLDVVDVWFGRTVIHSRHQMTYYQAQAIYDGKPPPVDVSTVFEGEDDIAVVREDLKTLVAFANKTNAVRVAHGAVELESAELRFETDAQTKSPTEVIQKSEVPMMRVVAELMILANSAAARATHSVFPSCALLRRHAPPRQDGFAELSRLAATKGVKLDCSSGEALNASLARIANECDPEVTTLFKGLATRAMSEAQYVSSGSISATESSFGHYGLALTYYTHFTSPIRRYADIVVHRQLIAAVEATEMEKKATEDATRRGLDSLAEHLNERNRASKRAQSRCGEIYLLWLLRENPMIEPAVVHEIRDDGLMVFLPSFHIKAPVRLVDDDGNAVEELRESDLVDVSPGYNSSESVTKWVQASPVVGVAGTRLRRSDDVLEVVRSSDGVVLRSYSLLQTVWVQMTCKPGRAQGPKLELRILDVEAHAGAREARLVARRAAPPPAPASLSAALKNVIKSRNPLAMDEDDAVDDLDTDENRDERVARHLNVPSKRLRDPLAASLAGLALMDDVFITVDDSPMDALRVVPINLSRVSDSKEFAARRAACDAWARFVSTRSAGAAGRARSARRSQRLEDAHARVADVKRARNSHLL